jgi:diadenosine tetraphosphate (Ap4A) HIT family hydrolase
MTINKNTPSGGVYEQRFKDWFFNADNDPRVLFKSEAHGLYVRLDDRPVTIGHSLAIPLESERYIDNMDPTRSDKLWTVSRHLGRHLMEVFGANEPDYIGVLVAGKMVHHAHVHRAVCYEGRDWIGGFDGQPRLELPDDQWAEVCERTAFAPDEVHALEADLNRIAPPEPLVEMEKQAYDLSRLDTSAS